ncbi:MAG: branched chain amino acid aminotransferase [Candidatus Binatia bacterium]|nr:MAG: branched chain amino acid aminotransferase [Candidatus Binatia bacterium]
MRNQMEGYVWLNGRITAAARARVSVFDRGFLYGDGLFETVRCYRGMPFLLDAHLQRMQGSAEFFGFPVPRVDWSAAIHKLLAANALLDRDASVRITVTRGTAPPGLVPPKNPEPTVLAFALPIPEQLSRDQKRGVKVITVPSYRSGPLATHKLLDYVAAILARSAAGKRKAQEALYVEDGYIAEATTANVFAVTQNDVLVTPPVNHLLPGITRGLVISLAERAKILTVERRISVGELCQAREVFLTSAVVEVLPVVEVDGLRIGGGKPGPTTLLLQGLYRQQVNQIVLGRERK